MDTSCDVSDEVGCTTAPTNGDARAVIQRKAQPSIWQLAQARLEKHLKGTAFNLLPMPADGDCFYHALAHRLNQLGKPHTVQQLRDIAGATGDDEAEEHHIRILIDNPVPVSVQFVKAELHSPNPTLNWGSAYTLGNAQNPNLTLVHWVHQGRGKHFDILEFVRPTRPANDATTNGSQLRGRTPARGQKRPTTKNAPPRRQICRLINGKVVRNTD